jgi:MFS transporter, DHA1 family, multidrug resistance protein
MWMEALAVLLLPMMLVSFGTGLIFPAAMAGAMQINGRFRGTAASILGSLQMFTGAAATALAAAFYQPTIIFLAAPVSLAGAMMLLAVRRS